MFACTEVFIFRHTTLIVLVSSADSCAATDGLVRQDSHAELIWKGKRDVHGWHKAQLPSILPQSRAARLWLSGQHYNSEILPAKLKHYQSGIGNMHNTGIAKGSTITSTGCSSAT